MLPELVPTYEERETARFCLYNWGEWRKLTAEERAACVAHYRLDRWIGMYEEEAVAKEIEHRTKKVKRGS